MPMKHLNVLLSAAAGARRPERTRQRGFTLVELLVAIALGLLVMIALIAVYTNVSRTNSEMARTNSMIENGRFAVDVLNEDLIHAGYWLGYVPVWDNLATRNVVPTGLPTTTTMALGPCLAYASWDTDYRNMLIGVPVETYRDAAPPGCSGVVTDRKSGTDVIVVRHVETCLPGQSNCEALDTAKVYFQASKCADEQGTITYVLGNVPADFTLKEKGCTIVTSSPLVTSGTVAPISKFDSHIYYVRTWSTTSGDGIPTLVRSSFGKVGGLPAHEPAQALVEGVEMFGVELGIDGEGRCAGAAPGPYGGSPTDYTQALSLGPAGNLLDPSTCAYNAALSTKNTVPTVRGDGVPERFVRCPAAGCSLAELMDVVAVRLYVLARSRDASPGHTDGKTYTLGQGGTDTMTLTPTGTDAQYKRHVFQTTLRLVNVSGRRETPAP
jgi:type IV pilus assembly protein PilW